MKIGLVLGSFDPIHIGHINIASCVLNSGLCDKVLFVVAQHNPWKKEAPAPFDVRCKMIEAAIKPFGDKCEVCRYEEEFEHPVYSYISIGKAIEEHPNDELFLIAGTDTIQRIPHWKNYETHIKDKIEIIEVSRSEDSHLGSNLAFAKKCVFDEKMNEFKSHYKIYTMRMDASSTVVRNMIADGMNPYPYITQDVLEIIKRNKLYGSS